LDISHTYRGDLKVVLSRGDMSVVLVDASGGGEDNLIASYEVTEFQGQEVSGEWTLTVSDNLARDEGQLNRWSLRILSAQE
jgi:serine protease